MKPNGGQKRLERNVMDLPGNIDITFTNTNICFMSLLFNLSSKLAGKRLKDYLISGVKFRIPVSNY